MDEFEKTMESLFDLWKERETAEDECSEDIVEQELLSIENTIEQQILRIATFIEQDHNLLQHLTQKYLAMDESKQTIVFHTILSMSHHSLFEKKIIHLNLIQNVLNDKNNRYYEPIERALAYCDLEVNKTVIELMLSSENPECVSSGLGAITQSRIGHFEKQCLMLITTIAHKEYKESDDEILGPLIDAIRSIKALYCISMLEMLIMDKTLKSEWFTWEQVLFSLVLLDSPLGWKIYKEKCLSHKLSPEDSTNLGIQGSQQEIDFVKEQLEAENYIDWTCGYLQSLGQYGDANNIELIISFLASNDYDIREYAFEAFYLITGTRNDDTIEITEDDCDKEDCVGILSEWWNEHKSRYDTNTRYDEGKPFSIQRLINDLGSPDSSTRGHAIEKLTAYTDALFPFNEYGFVHHRTAQQKAWQEWFDKNRNRYPDGGWYRLGKQLK